jgi:glyceraldehyde 3-phosphate dehydrogenase
MELTTPIIDKYRCFTTKEALSRHLTKRSIKVLLTAPGKGVPNIVHGVNQNEYNPMISTFSLPLLVQQMPSPNTESN